MRDIHQDILSWLHDKPNWLQEAAERLLYKDDLDENDIIELVNYLKTDDRQERTEHRKFTGLGKKISMDSSLHLISIGNIEGIENLSPRKPLTFGKGNLCVIYGHNGSGKSGYARILKKICGKPRAEELRPNVFKERPDHQKCIIKYRKDNDEKLVEWQVHESPVEELEVFDIFDKDEANFYINKETEISYTPPEVVLFEKLAKVCDRVKEQLQNEQDRLVRHIPDLPNEYDGTEIGKIYKNLKPDFNEEYIIKMTEWTDHDQKRLNKIIERLNTSNPDKLAEQKERQKRQLYQIILMFESAFEKLKKESCQNILELKDNAVKKRKVATEGAKTQTSSAKLDGIGTDTWNALWDAAREYSKKIAYPGREYPVTEDGALCVLCHQELSSESQKRLQDFESYVQGKLELDAKTAENNLKLALDELPEIPSEDSLRTQCDAAGMTEGNWFDKLKEFWEIVEEICRLLKDTKSLQPVEGIVWPADIVQDIAKRSEKLKEEIEQHKADADLINREELNKQKLGLEAKKWTNQQDRAIWEEINRLKHYEQYESWKKIANSRFISLKAGEISEIVITDHYVQRFNSELKTLGATNLRVELVTTRISKGRSKHQLRLSNVRSGSSDAISILSDGEKRIVALAAFLADVTGRAESSPFIFDDPISSLDHEFEWEVAQRLAKLAQERQVIVLTHRLSLYGLLEEAAKKIGEDWKRNNLEQRCIETFGGTSGHPADEQTWVQNTKKANNTLITRLDGAKKYWDAGESDKYKTNALSICTEFRKLLERTIEDDLLNEVVKRHRRSITTDNRLNYLSNIEKKDCEFLDSLMTKYSKYVHSQSSESPVDVPPEPELRNDLNALKEWRVQYKEKYNEK